MKILIASDAYYPHNVSGAAFFTYRLAKSLALKGNEVYVIAPSIKFRNTVTLEDGVKVYGVTSVPLPVYNKFRVSPITLIRSNVDKIIKKIRPDVIHIQNHLMIGKVAVEIGHKYGIPIIGTNHFMPENLVHYLHLPKQVEDKIIQISWNQFVKVYEDVDFVTTPTKIAADLIKGVGFPKKVEPISCGIDLGRFSPKNKGEYLKERYNIPPNVPVLLFVGRLDKEKNLDVVIRSLPKVLKVKDAHLVLAGTGGLRAKLELMVEEMGISEKVTFTGFVPDEDLPNLYAAADISIAPGSAELQCIAALEAIATGLPLVAANAVALPELVKEGKNGYLFTLGDRNSLADKLIKILSNPALARRMHRESLKIAKTHDMNAVISKFEALYRKAIKMNNLKRKYPKGVPFYLSREFAVKFAIVIIFLVALFKSSLSSPAVARAMESIMNSKIMNSKVVKSIENLDSKIDSAFSTKNPSK